MTSKSESASIQKLRQQRIQEMANAQHQQASRPIIRIQNLHKSFGNNHVLRGINLTIQEGKTTVIIGSSGSGKSVLIKHVIGLLKPDDGEILVNDVDITKLSRKDLNEARKQFGMCFQMAALFDSMTVYENVAFPLIEHTRSSHKEIQENVRSTLAKVGLQDIDHLYPAELSGGMRKRVGLARAVILRPAIIIYDEPTTGLDPLLTEEIDNLILETKEEFKVTSIVISHDVGSIFRIADHIAMLDKGHIVFDGTPQEALQTPNPKVQHFITTFG